MADVVRSVKARAISATTNAFDRRRAGAPADARTPSESTALGVVRIACQSGARPASTPVAIATATLKPSTFQSMPIARSSVLWAHVLTSLVANMISLVVVVLVALLMGFRSGAGPLAWLAVAGILALFTLALTWLAVIPGLTAKTIDGASAFSYPLIFLPFISSAFVPTATMPGPIRVFAENQPVTSIVNAIRALYSQQPVGSGIWVALAWCVGTLVVAYFFAMATYRRKIA